MRRMLWISLMTVLIGVSMTVEVQPRQSQFKSPRPPLQAEEWVKRSFAALEQGQYEQAIYWAKRVQDKYGNVHVRWFPSWLKRIVSEDTIPDPYDDEGILQATIASFKHGRGLNWKFLVRSTSPAWLIADAYFRKGEYEKALEIYEEMSKGIPPWIDAIAPSRAYLCRKFIAEGYRPPQPPPKNTWRPLPLKFREEDYFILVPLDEACKILGLGCSIQPNPKMAGGKGIRVTKPDAPNLVYRLFLGRPLVERLEGSRGQTETLAYAPYEENGVVWVPFYWLAKQAGIRGWEVRNGKIYVAPK